MTFKSDVDLAALTAEEVEHVAAIFQSVEWERRRQVKIYPKPITPVIWSSVLTEELGEAVREQLRGHDGKYREELVQLAAATIRAIVDFDNGFDTMMLVKKR